MDELNIIHIDLRYQSILDLHYLLCERNIPHEIFGCFDGGIIFYPNIKNRYGDVAIHKYTRGHENNLMEAYGFNECGDDVINDLTVDEALKLFIHAWEADKNAERSSN